MCEVRAEFLLKMGAIISLLIPCRAFVVSFLNKLHESCLQKKKILTGNFGYHSYEVPMDVHLNPFSESKKQYFVKNLKRISSLWLSRQLVVGRQQMNGKISRRCPKLHIVCAEFRYNVLDVI